MSERNLVLGTAGHIDHGKTALVRALTGTDTDRLPQEKARGMTIDIGFAEMVLGDCRIGIIDVPGHERFIKNMLAGAATIDMALLIVAADDSVMPQTREHLAILELLGIDTGVIALTKCDLRDEEWLELVEEEISELVLGTGLANAPIVRTAVPPAGPSQGLDALREKLTEATQQIAQSADQGLFRLCIDRSFTSPGRGTVVTGTVCSGSAHLGDTLEWLPRSADVQVRGLQNHGRNMGVVSKGQRAAINLTGVHHRDIQRGDVLASPDYLRPSRWLTVTLSVMPASPWPVKHRSRQTLHLGTQTTAVEIYLYGSNALKPGESGFAQLQCQEPVAAIGRQPFVIRAESPVVTLGGGRVLQAAARPLRRRHAEIEQLTALAAADTGQRVAAAILMFGDRSWTMLDLRRECDLPPAALEEAMHDLKAQGVLVALASDPQPNQLLHRRRFDQLAALVVREVQRFHQQQPLVPFMPRSQLATRLGQRIDRDLLEGIIAHLVQQEELQSKEHGIADAGFQPQLTSSQSQAMQEIGHLFRTGRFQPPAISQLTATLDMPDKKVRELLQLRVEQGELVHLGGDIYLDQHVERDMRQRLTDAFQQSGGMTVSQIRDILETSRKFALPICAYLDRIGFTRRDGDLRYLKVQ